jgi:hypothetical protein
MPKGTAVIPLERILIGLSPGATNLRCSCSIRQAGTTATVAPTEGHLCRSSAHSVAIEVPPLCHCQHLLAQHHHSFTPNPHRIGGGGRPTGPTTKVGPATEAADSCCRRRVEQQSSPTEGQGRERPRGAPHTCLPPPPPPCRQSSHHRRHITPDCDNPPRKISYHRLKSIHFGH